MFDKLFNRKNPDSKVVKDDDTSNGVSALRIIAKQTLLLPSIARELRSLNGAFARYVKLHNIIPATGEKISDISKSLSESKEIKVANIKVKKYGTEKKRTFLAGILDTFLTILKGLFLASVFSTAYIAYKLVEILTPIVTDAFSKFKEGIFNLADGIVSFFDGIDWTDLFKTAGEQFFNFISMGLFTKDQVNDMLGEAGSFYKEVIGGIGNYINLVLEWISPKLRSLGRYAAKDILGVDVDKLIERRAVKEELEKRSQQLQKEYAELDEKDKSLTDKKNSLTEQKQKLEKLQQQEQKKKEEEKKPTPAVKPEVKKEEKKLPPIEERSITLPPIVEKSVPAAPAPAAPSKAPSAQKESPIPQKPTAEKQKEEKQNEGSGDFGMKYTEGSNVIKINSKYGMRQLPGEEQPRLHGGIDYAAEYATPITFKGSMAKVVDASVHSGYGRVIDIIVEGELLRFAHLSRMLVKTGDKIEKGQTLGLVGDSGTVKGTKTLKEGAYGPHLHFEHRSKLSYDGKDTFDPVKTGATRMISFGNKIAATDYTTSEKYENYAGEYGKGLDSESSKLALAYRNQSKPQNPTYIAARTTNNIAAETKRTNVPAKV